MPSTINTTNIDPAFPIAGQDNDSQGFRDNFFNTNDNFVIAKAEIEDLQSKVILKSNLSGGTVDNDMAGELIQNVLLQGARGKVSDLGSVTGPTVVDVSDAPYFKMTTSDPIDLSFVGWSALATHSVVRVEINVALANHTIILPAAVTVGKTSLQNVTGNIITVPTAGVHIYEFSTTDVGASIAVNELTQSHLTNRILLSTPPTASALGFAGNKEGMVAYDSNFMYLCTADYDGATNIWVRSPITAPW